MRKFIVIIVLACPLFALADWVEQRLTLEWRNWLSSYLLRAYFANRAFFKLKQQSGSLDNPDQVSSPHPGLPDHPGLIVLSDHMSICDMVIKGPQYYTLTKLQHTIEHCKIVLLLQRICDDVPAFTNASTKLVLSVVRQFLNCVVFAGKPQHTTNDMHLWS